MEQLINQSLLLDLVDGDIETFTPILDDFESLGKEQLLQISDYVIAQDLEAVCKIAHQLKGSSGFLGMLPLYEYCKAIEELEIDAIDSSFQAQLAATFHASVQEARRILSSIAL